MKPVAIVLTALVLATASTGGALAHRIDTANLRVAAVAPGTGQCATAPHNTDAWSRTDLAHLLSYMHVPYDSITNAQGACLTVATRDKYGVLDQDVFNPATLAKVL